MRTLGSTDLRGVLDLVYDMRSLSEVAPFPRPIVERITQLVPCINAVHFERTNGHLSFVEVGVLEGSSAVDEAAGALGEKRPTAAFRLSPEDGPVKLSDRLSRRALTRLDFYREVMRPCGVEDELMLRLPAPRSTIVALSLLRDGPFTDRDRLVLGLLGTYLTKAREHLVSTQTAREELGLTQREWDVVRGVARGQTDKEIAATLLVTPATVQKHLENVFRKLGVHTRTAAVARAFPSEPS